jgi:acyl carrier protein
MTSKRPRGDKTWDYMRILPSVRPYIMMKPVYGDVCELIVLEGLKSKNTSNSDDPPNSFHTRDTFAPHPTIPDAWKFIGRLDDRVTLANGEKVLPVPIEGRIRQDALIREAVVFGIARDIPGLLVFRSEAARDLSDGDFISAIWPVVAEANLRAEGFSQISRDMIVPVSADKPYPQTDKGTIIRAQVYAVFAKQIDQVYERLLQNASSSAGKGQRELLRLEESELREFLQEMVRAELSIHLENSDSEFFAAGIDSLKAIQLAGLVKKQLYLGSNPEGVKLDQNTIYEKQNVSGLARYIYALQTGKEEDGDDGELELMNTLIERYSSFPKRSISLSGVEEAFEQSLAGDWCVVRGFSLPFPRYIRGDTDESCSSLLASLVP